MNRWDQTGVPQRGWRLVHVEDQGRAEHTCEMCGKEKIRYVHTLDHEDYQALAVGCVCASKMCAEYSPAEAEKSLHNRTNRRKRWLCGTWRMTRSGHLRREIDGRLVVIFDTGHGWRARLLDTDGAWKGGHRLYPSREDAAAAVFDHLYPPRLL